MCYTPGASFPVSASSSLKNQVGAISSSPRFYEKLVFLANDQEEDSIQWTSNGTAIGLFPEKLSKTVLETLSHGNKLENLAQKLRRYGFHRVQDNHFPLAYRHAAFQNGIKEMFTPSQGQPVVLPRGAIGGLSIAPVNSTPQASLLSCLIAKRSQLDAASLHLGSGGLFPRNRQTAMIDHAVIELAARRQRMQTALALDKLRQQREQLEVLAALQLPPSPKRSYLSSTALRQQFDSSLLHQTSSSPFLGKTSFDTAVRATQSPIAAKLDGIRNKETDEFAAQNKIAEAPLVDNSPTGPSFQEQKWEAMYHELAEFRRIHGHCMVPQYSCLREGKVCPQLARWVKRQRYQYKLMMAGRPSNMTVDRANLLNRIGFCWDSHGASWNDRFEELLQYKREHGNCNVPTSYVKNQRLAAWVKAQRRQHKLIMEGQESTLTSKRQAQLEAVGFEWRLRASRS